MAQKKSGGPRNAVRRSLCAFGWRNPLVTAAEYSSQGWGMSITRVQIVGDDRLAVIGITVFILFVDLDLDIVEFE